MALVYNGISHAVMMCTPEQLEDFALGFSLSEGVIDTPANVLDMSVQAVSGGIEIALSISQRCMQRLRGQRRALAGRTGCGICGTESLALAVREPARVSDGPVIASSTISAAVSALAEWSAATAQVSGMHCAAWCNANTGSIILIRRDVGRHNALDKLIGALRREPISRADGFLLLSSRASYEMVQKAATADMAIVVAVSAPTTLAVTQADRAGISLVARARLDSHRVFTHPQRILDAGE